MPETVTQWWREERATRIDLAELDPVGVDTLLHVVLEGPLDGAASAELWRASQGNLLVLHELVLGALADESLAYREGVWRLDGPLGAPTRLGDLVERRIDGLAPAGRAVLELLAMCQPVALSQLESSFGLDVLEALERDGLIAARTDGRRQSVSLAHPLHREVLRARVPAARARSILLGHAETLEQYGARRREDPVRIATLTTRGHRSRPIPTCSCAPPAWRASTTTSRPRLGSPTPRWRPARRPPAGSSLARRSTTSARSRRPKRPRRRNGAGHAEADLVAISPCGAATCSSAVAARTRRPPWAGPSRRGDRPSARAELMAGEAEMLAYSGRPVDALALLEHVDFSGPRLAVLAASRGPPRWR